MTSELFWKEVEVLWQKTDAVWAQADRVFSRAEKMKKPHLEGTTHRHHVRFTAKSGEDRWRTAWKFLKMAAAVIVRGRTELKFNENPAKREAPQ